MKTIWKWVLGILFVLLLVAAFTSGWWMMRFNRMQAYAGEVPGPFYSWNNGPMMRAWHDGPMMRGWDGGPMMRVGRGFDGGFMFGGIGWLLRLAFFGLLLYGAYWLGRRNARIVTDPRTPPPPDEIPPAS